MVLWSVLTIPTWQFIDGFYFAVASLSGGGMWAIPSSSSVTSFAIAGAFTCTGIPIMAAAYVSIIGLTFQLGIDNISLLKAMDTEVSDSECLFLTELFGCTTISKTLSNPASVKNLSVNICQSSHSNGPSSEPSQAIIPTNTNTNLLLLKKADFIVLCCIRLNILTPSVARYILERFENSCAELGLVLEHIDNQSYIRYTDKVFSQMSSSHEIDVVIV